MTPLKLYNVVDIYTPTFSFFAEHRRDVSCSKQVLIDEEDYTTDRSKHAISVILDFDDTLSATTYFQNLEPNISLKTKKKDLKPDTIRVMGLLETEMYNTLLTCIKVCMKSDGKVYIVTNAQKIWVIWCIVQLYPKILPLMKYITLFSASDNFSKRYPDRSNDWKVMQYKDIITERIRECPNKKETVVSVGDCNYERFALFLSTFHQPFFYSINIKTQFNPSLFRIIEQLRFLSCMFTRIPISSESVSLDLSLEAERGIVSAQEEEDEGDEDEETENDDVSFYDQEEVLEGEERKEETEQPQSTSSLMQQLHDVVF
jgi:hypothetical protein